MQKISSMVIIIDNISEWSGKIVGFLFFPLILIVVFEVLMRYAFNSPTIWVHDISGMIFGTLIILGGAYVLRHGDHIKVDLLWLHLPLRGRAILDLFTYTLFFLFCGVMFWKGIGMASRSWAVMEVTLAYSNIPVYPVKTMIPLGAFLILLQGLAKYIRDIFVAVTGRQLT